MKEPCGNVSNMTNNDERGDKHIFHYIFIPLGHHSMCALIAIAIWNASPSLCSFWLFGVTKTLNAQSPSLSSDAR